MKILDVNGMEIENPDLEQGYIENDRVLVAHHPEIQEVEEVFHYEYERFPNGGKNRKKVIDVPAVRGVPAWDEYEDILRYIQYDPKELALREYEKTRAPFTLSAVMERLIPVTINVLPVDHNTALRMKRFYPKFEDVVGQTLVKGNKFTYADELWEVQQPSLLMQAHYAPGVGTESLYLRVDEEHEGTEADPIPYNGNMVLESGKYYFQNNALYLCFRDTGNPVYHDLDELLELYVNLVWRMKHD